MSIKNLSFHLLLSVSLSISAFASDNEDKSGGGMKRTAQAAFGDTSSSSAAKKPKHEESIVALNEKPSIYEFPIRESKEYTLRGPALFSVEDKLGVFFVFPNEIIIKILSYVNPYQTMGIGSTFYTFATGYKKERMGLIGLGPDKEPDYADSIFSIREEGIRVRYDDNDEEYDNNTKSKYPIHAPSTIPSTYWYVYLKRVEALPEEYYPYHVNTNIDFFRLFKFKDAEHSFIKMLPSKLKTLSIYIAMLKTTGLAPWL